MIKSNFNFFVTQLKLLENDIKIKINYLIDYFCVIFLKSEIDFMIINKCIFSLSH